MPNADNQQLSGGGFPASRGEKAAPVVCCNREMHRRPLSRMVTGEVRPFVGEAADTRYSNRSGGGPKNCKGVPLREEDSARQGANHRGQKINFVALLTHASQHAIAPGGTQSDQRLALSELAANSHARSNLLAASLYRWAGTMGSELNRTDFLVPTFFPVARGFVVCHPSGLAS